MLKVESLLIVISDSVNDVNAHITRLATNRKITLVEAELLLSRLRLACAAAQDVVIRIKKASPQIDEKPTAPATAG